MIQLMVDTDVLIWVLRGKSEAIAWMEDAAREGNLLCSVLTVSELFRMVRREELRKTETLLDALQVVPVLYEDARRAADLMREHGPGFVDCHIAAAALRLDAQVMIYNRRDFERTGALLVAAPE